MISDFFGTLLNELSKTTLIPIPGLRADRNNSCLIQLKADFQIQMELDASGDNLVIGCDIGEPPDGRFKQDLFREALKFNGLPAPRVGVFAYSTKTKHIVFFRMLPTKDLTGEKVASVLIDFVDKAMAWKKAISANEIPVVSGVYTSQAGMFGLRS